MRMCEPFNRLLERRILFDVGRNLIIKQVSPLVVSKIIACQFMFFQCVIGYRVTV